MRRTVATANVTKVHYPTNIALNYNPLYSTIGCNPTYSLFMYADPPCCKIPPINPYSTVYDGGDPFQGSTQIYHGGSPTQTSDIILSGGTFPEINCVTYDGGSSSSNYTTVLDGGNSGSSFTPLDGGISTSIC